MSLSRFKSSNHPQQTAARGPLDDIDDRATHPLLFDELDERYGPFLLIWEGHGAPLFWEPNAITGGLFGEQVRS